MEFVVIARYRAREGEAERVAEALAEMVAPTRAEPGNLDYQVFRDPSDPSLFVLFERYADAEGFDAHRATPHFGTWLAGVVLPALDDRIRLDLVPLGDYQHLPRRGRTSGRGWRSLSVRTATCVTE